MARVLFVDDEADTLKALKKAVELFGHKASLAGTAQEALRLVSRQALDLIFIDRRLPDMDGLELTRALKEDAALRDIPVVILSAGPELDAAERARVAGAQAYLLKPVRLQMLLDVISAYSPPESGSPGE